MGVEAPAASLSAEDSDILWHYTTDIGFHGIISSHAVWATPLAHLNDYTEGLQALELVRSVCDRLSDEIPALRGVVDGFLAAPSNTWLERIRVFCTSRVPDRLDSWRVNAPAGRGYALGFSQAALSTIATVHECEYVDATRLDPALIERYLGHHVSEIMRHHRMGDLDAPLDTRAAIGGMLVAVPNWAPRIKHNAFRQEEETRLIVQEGSPDAGVAHVRGTRMIRRTVIPLPEDAITHVVIGPGFPTRDWERDREGLRGFLRDHGFNIEPEHSTVPLQSV